MACARYSSGPPSYSDDDPGGTEQTNPDQSVMLHFNDKQQEVSAIIIASENREKLTFYCVTERP